MNVTTTFTAKIAGVAVTDGVITIATGGAAGDVDSATPSALKTVTAGQAIEILGGGEGATATKAVLTIEIDTA